MNWVTSRIVEGQSVAEKQRLLDKDGGCEHVEADVSLGYILYKEQDSFGTVGTSLCCKACADAAKEEEDNEEHTCVDCKQSVKRKDGIFWKWYDFYPAQGDEPLFVGNCCRSKATHQSRVARDKAAYDAEFNDD